MASFDVESLLVDAPLLTTTEVIVNNIDTAQLNKLDLTA